MLKRLFIGLLWPLVLLLLGGVLFAALSGVIDGEQDVSLLFLLWISLLPVTSGWAWGRHTPRPVPETALRAAGVWGGFPLLAVLLLPGVYPGPGLLWWVLGGAFLGGLGVYLGAAHSINLHLREISLGKEEEK